jgi:hypothetical protein
MLTVLLPVTRDWTREAVIAALGASDIPRGDLLLVEDAPDLGKWKFALHDLGFNVAVTRTGNPSPPDTASPRPRRARQAAMRELTARLVPDGPLLCLDDDTLVPPDVYARLRVIGPHATAVQVGRYGTKHVLCGVYRGGKPLRLGSGVESVEACGHYCLLTTGAMYRATCVADPGTGQMKPIEGLRVDWGCVCGHLTRDGALYP